MPKEIIYNTDARQKMKEGLDKVADAVKVTLGPRGKNVIIKPHYGEPTITKDGVTVAKEITLSDPFQELGAQLCKQVSKNTNDSVGDGTTTSTVLVQALVSEGLKFIANGSNPMAIKRGIDKAVSEVIKYINSQSKEISISDPDSLKFVASISGNNDPELGEIVSKAFIEAGESGMVTFEESKGRETTVEVLSGFTYERGYLSPYFITNRDKGIAEYDNALVLLWDKRITSPLDLVPLADRVGSMGVPLLIIADGVEGDALAALALTALHGKLQIVATQCPGFGERKKNFMRDLAVLTGGKYFAEELNPDLKKVSVTDLGTIKKLICTKDSTTLISNTESPEIQSAVSTHLQSLKSQLAEAEDSFDKEKLVERISKLVGKAAIIKLGANIESEMKEKKFRYEDAISATKAALQAGVVAGGGTVLFNASKSLEKIALTSVDEDLGISLVRKALKVPLATILENAGFEQETINSIFSAVASNKGFDGRTGKIVQDMVAEGIIDPTSVVVSTVQSAGATAGIFLTLGAAIVDAPKKD